MANNNTKARRRKTKTKTGKTTLISKNDLRNMAMRVYWNKTEHGKVFSTTAHEPLDANQPKFPKKHNNYKQ